MTNRFLFLILLMAGIAAGGQAQTFSAVCTTGQELKYQIPNDHKTVAVMGIVGKDYPSVLVIPDAVTFSGNTYSVTSIWSGELRREHFKAAID